MRQEVERYQKNQVQYANMNRYVSDIPLLENRMTGTNRHFTNVKEAKLGRVFEGVDPTEPPFFSIEQFDFERNARLRAIFALDEDDPSAEQFPYESSFPDTASKKRARSIEGDLSTPQDDHQAKAPRTM